VLYLFRKGDLVSISISEIFKATQLTKGGRLMEATRMIQRALGLASRQKAPVGEASPHSASAPHSTPHSAPRRAAGAPEGDQAVSDVPFRETLKQPANESPFRAPVQDRAAQQPAPVMREKADAPAEVDAPLVQEPTAPTARPAPASKPRPASFAELSFRSGDTPYAYRLYVPGSDGLDATAHAAAAEPALMPLVVLLHGCKQNATDFALGTGMNELAEAGKYLVLYPEQSSSANSMRCWNWFDAAHQSRGSGEPKMIAALIAKVIKTHGADPSRVYIAGLSAGGAMAAIMAGLYPELFAAVGVHSGLPPGAANDVISAFSAMRRGASKTRAAGDGANDANADENDAFVMPTIVFHGSADKTVNPDNGEQITDAALAALGGAGIRLKKVEQSEDSPGTPSGRRDTTRTIYRAADGKSFVEHWAIGSGPHAWSGGDAAGSFTDPHGPSASQAMVEFFLQHRR
jgi:poly(hydroxyalkanoate) depolymerase family esterase